MPTIRRRRWPRAGSDTDVDNIQTRKIDWNADVNISSGQSAELVIDDYREFVRPIGISGEDGGRLACRIGHDR